MGTPSGIPRHPDERNRDLGDALRRIGSPAIFAEDDDHAPREALGETACGLPDRPGLAHSLGRTDPPSSETPEATGRDDDLERFQASLRWLQSQERATRLARSQQPFPPLAPFDAPTARYGSERYDLRSPLSLEPARLAPPPESQRSWQVPLAVAVGCALSAAIGYYVAAAGPWSQPLSPATEVRAGAPSQVITASLPKRAFESRLIEARDDEVPTTVHGEPSTAPQAGEAAPARTVEQAAPVAVATAPVAVAALQPDALANEARPEKAIPALDAGEIELLMQRAQQFIATGDLVTARTLLQRAAQAGAAAAAVALGATYDPLVQARLGVVGISPDVEKARSWYRMAESLGSSEATRRLAAIENR
jgi:hypothetical protein